MVFLRVAVGLALAMMADLKVGTTPVMATSVVPAFRPAVSVHGPDLSTLETTFKKIVNSSRGTTGVALIHLESGRHILIRGDERCPMASVVKLPLAVELLKQVSERRFNLDRDVWITASDIRPCCMLSRRHPDGGVSRTARELLYLMMIESDNTAADVLLRLVGGPPAVERRLRALGFQHINVNRSEGQLLLDMAGVTGAPPPAQWTLELQRRLVAEVTKPELNDGRERYLRDERDTATPYDMALFLGRLQLGNLLPKEETDLLLDLMTLSATGPRRIKGRLPPETRVAHKTGTTAIVINDVGIIALPADSSIGGHLALAAFITNGSSITAMERTIAQLSAAAFEFFTGKVIPAPAPAPRKARTSRRR
jgi:beta-lactamase class A